MRAGLILCCFIVVLSVLPSEIKSQGPPRLSIPGAVLVDGPRPRRIQQQQPLLNAPIPIRRKQIPNTYNIPQREVRPVVEEREEIEEPRGGGSILDEEVARLTSSALNSIRQVQEEEPEERPEPPRPLQFRPERPLPITRENVREPSQRPQPVRQEAPRPILRPSAPPRQQAVREQYQRPKNAPQFEEDDELQRRRKPQVQILRKYRTDNEDGSITWGFENEDGTYKEENIGIDCIIRGKYGYVDPDGEKREFTYEAGNKCDEPEEEELELESQPQNLPRPRPDNNNNIGPRPQYRPQYKS